MDGPKEGRAILKKILFSKLKKKILVKINCILGKWPACIHQSAPEGYFKTEDCRTEKYFVCKMNKNSEFSTPPQGYTYFEIFFEISTRYRYYQPYI